MSGFAAPAPRNYINFRHTLWSTSRRMSTKRQYMIYRNLLRKRRHRGVALISVDALFFGLTDPTRAPSIFFIVAFLLMLISLYSLFRGACWVVSMYGLRVNHERRAAMISGGIIAGLMALQSIGQLTFRDLFVIVPLISIAYFYISYNQQTVAILR
jgi:hypothetical protein